MTRSERRLRDLFTRWWGGSATRRSRLRRNRDQLSDAARRAQDKLRDLRDSDAAHRAQERAQEALRDLRTSDAARRAQDKLRDAEAAAREAYARMRRSSSG